MKNFKTFAYLCRRRHSGLSSSWQDNNLPCHWSPSPSTSAVDVYSLQYITHQFAVLCRHSLEAEN